MAEQNDKFDSKSKRKPPLFPANFVTIVQLKERWSREQERKQREKEEEEEEEEERQKKVVEGAEAESQGVKRKPINCRNQSRRYDLRDRSRGHERLESAVKEAESGGLKNQKKEKSVEWREKSKKEERAKDEEVIGGEKEAPPSQTSVEKEKVPTRKEWGARGAPRHFTPRIQNATVEIRKKIGGLSVNGANRGDHRYSIHARYYDRSNSEFGRDCGRLHRPGKRNSRNAGMMWVKKGEVGDGSAGDLLSKGLD
ncbi:hypothetical protein SLA2020_150660 [Shorea laevis]